MIPHEAATKFHGQRVNLGGRQHREYWIPAEDLESFNDAIVGEITIVAEYRGDPPQRIR